MRSHSRDNLAPRVPVNVCFRNAWCPQAIDATTAKRLRKLMRFLRHQGVTLIMTDMNSKVLSVLENEVPDPSLRLPGMLTPAKLPFCWGGGGGSLRSVSTW